MKTTLLALMLTLLPTLTGCLIAPVPAFGRKTVDGTRIHKEDVAFLQPGRTTREELVKRFGEPWAHYRDVEVMVYYWDVRKGYWVWGIIIPEAVAAGGRRISRASSICSSSLTSRTGSRNMISSSTRAT